MELISSVLGSWAKRCPINRSEGKIGAVRHQPLVISWHDNPLSHQLVHTHLCLLFIFFTIALSTHRFSPTLTDPCFSSCGCDQHGWLIRTIIQRCWWHWATSWMSGSSGMSAADWGDWHRWPVDDCVMVSVSVWELFYILSNCYIDIMVRLCIPALMQRWTISFFYSAISYLIKVRPRRQKHGLKNLKIFDKVNNIIHFTCKNGSCPFVWNIFTERAVWWHDTTGGFNGDFWSSTFLFSK